MMIFATEFPLKPIENSRGQFLAHTLAWLRGNKFSTVLSESNVTDLDAETAFLQSRSGEELRVREALSGDGEHAIGVRHDFPDNRGRVWKTEATLQFATEPDRQHQFRLRTQCIAKEPSARLETPLKPYLIKAVLNDNWGGEDGHLTVVNTPHRLPDNTNSLQMASQATFGNLSNHLPVIYCSAQDGGAWPFTEDEINKLAFDLGGVAHVVVEPTRAFSFRLRDMTQGLNVYGGAIGVALPQHGIRRRYLVGGRFGNARDVLLDLRHSVINMRSDMPSRAWGWSEVQEQALRKQRDEARNRLSAEESEQLYQEQITNLEDQVADLSTQLKAQKEASKPDAGDIEGFIDEELVARNGKEIYPGECSDRLLMASKNMASRAEQLGLDARSKAVFESVVRNLTTQSSLTDLLAELKHAARDSGKATRKLTDLLLRHGYARTIDNKHIKLEPDADYPGLETLIFPKTPSDHRALKNLQKEIERKLGLSKLK